MVKLETKQFIFYTNIIFYVHLSKILTMKIVGNSIQVTHPAVMTILNLTILIY